MYPEPLEPGQAFSFVNAVYAVEAWAADYTAFVTTSRVRHGEHSGRKTIIRPSARLIVQDEMYLVGDAWHVRTWLPEFGRQLGFLQKLGPEVVESFVPHWFRPHVMSGAYAVKDVGWPDPTSEVLMVHVRALSRWPNGSARGRSFKRNPIAWRDCRPLSAMPLDQGLPEALRLLQGHVDDPAAALRARGFAV